MQKKDMIMYASIAGGAYLAYWYLTNYGPGGPVSASVLSYWDTWFGGQTAVAPAPQQAAPAPAPGVAVPAPGNTGTSLPPAPASTAGLRAQLVAAAQGNLFMVDGKLNGDQWNYYRNQLAPPELTAAQMLQAFPNGMGQQLMTVDQFLAALNSAGLSGVYGVGGGTGVGAIVPTQSMQSIPSMTFGGGLRPGGGMRQMLTMGGNGNGQVN